MPCGLCHTKERSIDEAKVYLCGKCLMLMIGLDKYKKRTYIDSLYMAGKDEEAEFLENFFNIQAEKKGPEKPKLLVRKRDI